MTDLLQQHVPRMPPLSMRDAIARAGRLLADAAPEHLTTPGRLNLAVWINAVLPSQGINVYPADTNELGADLGQATFDDSGGRVILLRADYYDAVLCGGAQETRARATLLHEIPHAIYHLPLLGVAASTAQPQVLRRGEMKPFFDPDWQAWAIGCCLGAPPQTLELLHGEPLERVARCYGLSAALVHSHVRRLHRFGFRVAPGGQLHTPRGEVPPRVG